MLKYIYRILSKNESKIRIVFYLPWLGIVVGTMFLLLINGIMEGMEDKIFSSINKHHEGYKVTGLTYDQFDDYEKRLIKHNLNYKIESVRDVVLTSDLNYSIVKLVISDDLNENDNITVGQGIAMSLDITNGDKIKLFSPLDIGLTTMIVPSIELTVDSIYSIPVVDFDKLYIFTNNSNFNRMLNSEKYIIIKDSLSKEKIESLKDSYDNIDIVHWLDTYNQLISAINIEKRMYQSFAYLLIIISCLGIFTISNHTLVNKMRSFAVLNVFGINNRQLRNSIFMLMLLFTSLSTAIGFIVTRLLVYFHLLDP